MRSITHGTDERKPVRIIKGGLGYVIKGQSGGGCMVKNRHTRQEGDIKGFSRHSQRRLRETLALARPANPQSMVCGMCLTIPGAILPPEKVRNIWHAFMVEMGRQYADVGLVWRIELQTRQQAHWHLVAWIPPKGEIPPLARALLIAELYKRVVVARVAPLTPKTSFGFDKYGVKIQPLDSATPSCVITYLADHESKHKQAQLGWQGRQWGVVGRDNLRFIGSEVVSVDERQHKRAARQFRRLQQHLRSAGKYTGVRVTPSGNVSKSIFGKDAERLLKCYEMEVSHEGTR